MGVPLPQRNGLVRAGQEERVGRTSGNRERLYRVAGGWFNPARVGRITRDQIRRVQRGKQTGMSPGKRSYKGKRH